MPSGWSMCAVLRRIFFRRAAAFPWQILPVTCGVVVADAHSAAVLREAPHHPLHASRRKALTLRFALAAGQRLSSVINPRA